MAMGALFNHVDNIIFQYEQACSQEKILYELLRNAENDMHKYNSFANSSADDFNLKKRTYVALEYQKQLQQVQAVKELALHYLCSTKTRLSSIINSIKDVLPKIDRSIAVFEKMTLNLFGSSAATAQLPLLHAKRNMYQKNLNAAYTITDKIDAVLNDDGDSPRRILRRVL